MLANLPAAWARCLSLFFPEEVSILNTDDSEIRPFKAKIRCGFCVNISFYVRCTNKEALELRSKGVRVYAFDAADTETAVWVDMSKVDHLIELCRDHASYPLYGTPWM